MALARGLSARDMMGSCMDDARILNCCLTDGPGSRRKATGALTGGPCIIAWPRSSALPVRCNYFFLARAAAFWLREQTPLMPCALLFAMQSSPVGPSLVQPGPAQSNLIQLNRACIGAQSSGSAEYSRKRNGQCARRWTGLEAQSPRSPYHTHQAVNHSAK